MDEPVASGSQPRPRIQNQLREEELSATIINELRNEEPLPSNNFAFTPSQLLKLLDRRDVAALRAFGGIRGLEAGLRTNLSAGLGVDETTLAGTVTFDEAIAAASEQRRPILQPMEHAPARPSLSFPLGDNSSGQFADRKRIFGANRLPRRRQKSFFRLMWIAFNDKLIILLTISAVISLAIGIYQSVTADEDSSNIEWVDGLTVVVAIIVIVLASAATDFQKNLRFEKLSERNQHRNVSILRSGKMHQVSIYDVMVGDVMHVEAGEVLVADGVLIKASSLYIDEASISGESQLAQKVAADDSAMSTPNANPFILSGTTVRRGVGRYLVTSIGANSTYGKTLMSLGEDVQETPLQTKLGRLGKQLIVFGAAAGSVYFCILFIRYLIRLPRYQIKPATQKAEAFLHIVMLAITIVVITVPEGLGLNVTVALAFATKKMLKDNNLVRLIRSCEIMGNATSICSDKTGTLTQNKMTVIAGRVGVNSGFDDNEVPVPTSRNSGVPSVRNPTSRQFMATLSSDLKEMLRDSIALNSTAFEKEESTESEYIGSSTETALLQFAREHLGLGLLRQERDQSPIITMLPFDPARKWMAVLIKLKSGKYRLLVKGAAEIVFEFCAYTIGDPTYQLTGSHLEENDRRMFQSTIHDYANNLLRPVAMSFKDFDESEVLDSPDQDPATVNLEWMASGMVFIGFFGIRDPLRPEVVNSVRACQEAGVFVRMVTGDNFLTAKAVASECGIYTAGGVAMDGPTFRKLTTEQQNLIIPRLQVLARSSPEDKHLLVTRLKQLNETVAVTGDGTNDALALKEADVGFAMGIQGTEVAKEAACIILLDDNFASIVKALSWGRTVIDAVKKFCQFQFTINITAGITSIISELVGDSIFTVVQLLWINLIMDIFASLALATDHPSPDLLKRKPEQRNAPIVSITMWKMIIGQSIYQLLVVFLVHYVWWDLFDPSDAPDVDRIQTLVFNIYVWMQFFNQHNCRRVDNKLDIWYQGFFTNPWFLGVQCITIVGQFIIIFKGGEAFDTEPLSGAQWGWSLLFGFLTIPLGALIRQIPDRYVLDFFLAVKRCYLFLTAPFRSCFARLTRKEIRQIENESAQELGAVESLVIRSGRALVHPMVMHPVNSPFGKEEDSIRSLPEKRLATGTTAEIEVREEIDLYGLIEAAKLGRFIEEETFELHPRTLKNDPIIGLRSNPKLAPSQDPAIQEYIKRTEVGSNGSPVRRTTSLRQIIERYSTTAVREPPRPTPTRTRSRRMDGFDWETVLRSKRR